MSPFHHPKPQWLEPQITQQACTRIVIDGEALLGEATGSCCEVLSNTQDDNVQIAAGQSQVCGL